MHGNVPRTFNMNRQLIRYSGNVKPNRLSATSVRKTLGTILREATSLERSAVLARIFSVPRGEIARRTCSVVREENTIWVTEAWGTSPVATLLRVTVKENCNCDDHSFPERHSPTTGRTAARG